MVARIIILSAVTSKQKQCHVHLTGIYHQENIHMYKDITNKLTTF